ncbi:MAG: type II toxin-antitoxin system PemK/MazF family toxin [Eubacterium sp.]|nr:type II toxin-antitoxin system PemK/MazF family toxin [Eubacterium sp.]
MREIKRGEIYYANLCPVIGSEQGGIRPVIILQNDIGNRFSPTTIVAAITSRAEKTELPTHVNIRVEGLNSRSIILLEQIRTIDKSRIREFVDILDINTMSRVDKAIVISLGISDLI